MEQKETLGLGIDISKNKADICLKKDSQVLESFVVSNDEGGIATLLQRLERYKDGTFSIKAAIESTANLWINMYEALERNGVDISLANPLKTKAIAEAKIKSDKIDAAVLADLLRNDSFAFLHGSFFFSIHGNRLLSTELSDSAEYFHSPPSGILFPLT
ncbi:MAG: transposase [Nitrososphaera sp.]